MRRYSIALFTLTALLSVRAWSSESVDEVVKLAEAGVSQDVVMAFVQAAPASYELTADEIKMLRDKGVSATVIVAMIDHGKEIGGANAGSQPTTAPIAPGNSAPLAQPVNQPIDEPNAMPGTPTGEYAGDPNSSPTAPGGISTTVVAPPAQDANISYFYETMAPHGTWHETSVGYAFQPNVVTVQANWQPYANDGHWLWTDAGWYWESNYPWGWAAFHYGRWNRDASLGWVWIPDTTWGPAWVSWRHSDAFYGWAPLPSHARFDAGVGFSFHDKHVDANFEFGLGERDYAFVPSDRFLDVNIGVALLGHEHVREAYGRTTVINNTYIYNDNRIINNGVPQAEVVRRTGRNVETVRVTDANYAAGTAVRGEVRSRNSIAVFRPAIANAAPRDPATAIARSTYVRRDVVYRHVTQDSDRVAERRLTTEVTRRAGHSQESVTRSVDKRDDAAQRRLDEEVAQRERARNEPAQRERAKVQETRERDVRETRMAPQAREDDNQTALRREAQKAELQQQREIVKERQADRGDRANQAREEAATKKASRDDGKQKKHGHDE